jgi:hypothetical protein
MIVEFRISQSYSLQQCSRKYVYKAHNFLTLEHRMTVIISGEFVA